MEPAHVQKGFERADLIAVVTREAGHIESCPRRGAARSWQFGLHGTSPGRTY